MSKAGLGCFPFLQENNKGPKFGEHHKSGK